MSMYAIKDTTLTALGDAVRNKTSKYIAVEEKGEPFFTATIDTTLVGPSYTYSGVYYYEVPIDFPTLLGDMYDYMKRLYVEYEYEVSLNQFWCKITSRSDEQYKGTQETIVSIFDQSSPLSGTGSKYGSISTLPYNQLQLNVYPTWIESETAKVSVKIWACDANDKFLVLNKYTPLEMVDKINGLMAIPDEAFYLTGNKSYAFQYNNNKWMINSYGDKITTDKLTNIGYMFQYSDGLTAIPFDLNIDSSKTNVNSPNLFANCSNLKEAPLINNYYVSTCNGMFSNCRNLRNLPVGFAENWDFSGIHNSTNSLSSFFNNCYSLREVPEVLRKNLWNKSTASYSSGYNYGFNSCYSLDELTDLGITTVSLKSNVFGNTFSYTFRLAELTFEVNEDGTPKTANWESQTIDLSKYVGYINGNASNVTNYNSGITADKEVKDDATYQALKNDPDWFTCDINYSRYNHDSAVRTINSLPDTSAYLASNGGTNTIKFKGQSGASTDGGAINTLTEEEIAVATAKGWTVSLV